MRIYVFYGLLLFAPAASFAQWDSIGWIHPDCVIASETDGYYFTNTPSGYHGNTAELYKSSDGFKTWDLYFQQSGDMGCCIIRNIFFCNGSEGFMSTFSQGYGGYYRTMNGALSWSAVFGCAPLTNIFFLRPTYGYSIWPDYATSNGKGAIHLFNNGHDTVQFVSTQYTFSDANEEWIYFINDSTGFISCHSSSNKVIILRTSDFGISWTPLPDSIGTKKQMQFPDNSTGYYLNTSGDLYTSHDLGESWQWVCHVSNETLNSIFFTTSAKGYIVGNKGLIMKTLDGGIQWETEIFKPSADLVRIQFVNDSVGFLITRELFQYSYLHFLYKTYPGVFISEHQEKTSLMSIHPNPTHTKLYLEFPSAEPKPCILEIISMTGESKITLDRFQPVINISGLPAGLYGLKYQASEAQGLIRFVVSPE